jgi:hypothetical protein
VNDTPEKTPGQEAYERHCALYPHQVRPRWHALNSSEQKQWERRAKEGEQ